MRFSWIKVSLKPNDRCPINTEKKKTHREDSHVKTEAETRVMSLQAKGHQG